MYLWCTSLLPGRFCCNLLQIMDKAKRMPAWLQLWSWVSLRDKEEFGTQTSISLCPQGLFTAAGERGWEHPWAPGQVQRCLWLSCSSWQVTALRPTRHPAPTIPFCRLQTHSHSYVSAFVHWSSPGHRFCQPWCNTPASSQYPTVASWKHWFLLITLLWSPAHLVLPKRAAEAKEGQASYKTFTTNPHIVLAS